LPTSPVMLLFLLITALATFCPVSPFLAPFLLKTSFHPKQFTTTTFVLRTKPDRLPISYRSDNGTRDSEFNIQPLSSPNTNATSITTMNSPEAPPNFYAESVSRLTPSDLINRFLTTAPDTVQAAVKTTILGLIGTLPKLAFKTNTVTTGERLANLMFQLQMTGYMFKNAEYRAGLTESLGLVGSEEQSKLLSGTATEIPPSQPEVEASNEPLPKISGKVSERTGGNGSQPQPQPQPPTSTIELTHSIQINSNSISFQFTLRAFFARRR